MGQETNNEIDLLLRRLSRRQGAAAPDSDHLDADELSSYAENALPAASRARYTEHLAECSRCRELVVQLSSAAGVVVAEEPSRVAASSGLTKFLASLFSPMVLRYAVPALGLMVVAVIGLTIFRKERLGSSPDMVATSRQADTPAAKEEAKPQTGFTYSVEKSALPSPTAEPRRGRNEAEPPAPVATPAANTPTDANKEAPVAKTDSTTVATAVPPPAAPKPAETSDEVRKQENEEQKKLAQERPAATPQTERERDFQAGRVAPAGVATTRRAAKTGALAAGESQGAGASTAQTPSDKDRADAETRTVAGRRFRKQRDIWVDTAYAGAATVNLTRGSEQYRSLVADEPEIRNIADQLDGQIIVVWKGRAYKIR
jgi:putative zinc finger protein